MAEATEAETSVEVFADDYGGVEGVALLMHEPSIVEKDEGELVAACKLAPEQALRLAGAIIAAVESM